MWLLLFVKLALAPEPHVVEVEIMEFFDSEKKCIEKIETIPKESLPPNHNMGCVPLNGRKI